MASGNTNNTKERSWLIPWKPGQSGNPNGRPKTPVEVREAFRAMSMNAARQLDNLAHGYYEISIPEADTVKLPCKPEHSLKAAETILARAYGQPIQPVAVAESRQVFDSDKLSQQGKEHLVAVYCEIIDNGQEAENASDEEEYREVPEGSDKETTIDWSGPGVYPGQDSGD